MIGVLGARPDRVDQYIQNKANEQKAAAAAATNIATLNVDQKKSDIELDKEKKLAAYKKQIGVTDDGDVVSNTKSYPNEWVDPTSGMHYNLSDSIYNMVEHGQDPSQLTKRGKNYDANLKRANEYSFARYGHPFDAAQAMLDYNYAKNPRTQNTIKCCRA